MPGYPTYVAQQSQIARQATGERNNPLPATVLEGVAKYEGTVPDAERLFNRLTTHIADLGTSIAGIKTDMADMNENVNVKDLKERVATLERKEAVNNLHIRFFIEQAIGLALDYANGKGVKIDFEQVMNRLKVNMALDCEGLVAAADGVKKNEKNDQKVDGIKEKGQNDQKVDKGLVVAKTAATAAASIPIIVEHGPEPAKDQFITPAAETVKVQTLTSASDAKNVQSSTPTIDPYEKPSDDEFDDSDDPKPIMKIRKPKSKSAESAKSEKGKGKASVLSSPSPVPAPAPITTSSPTKSPEVAAPLPWTSYGQEALDEAKAFMSTASRGGSKNSRGTQVARSPFAAPPARPAPASAFVRPTAPAFRPAAATSTTDDSRFPFRANNNQAQTEGVSSEFPVAYSRRQGLEASMWAPKNFGR